MFLLQPTVPTNWMSIHDTVKNINGHSNVVLYGLFKIGHDIFWESDAASWELGERYCRVFVDSPIVSEYLKDVAPILYSGPPIYSVAVEGVIRKSSPMPYLTDISYVSYVEDAFDNELTFTLTLDPNGKRIKKYAVENCKAHKKHCISAMLTKTGDNTYCLSKYDENIPGCMIDGIEFSELSRVIGVNIHDCNELDLLNAATPYELLFQSDSSPEQINDIKHNFLSTPEVMIRSHFLRDTWYYMQLKTAQ